MVTGLVLDNYQLRIEISKKGNQPWVVSSPRYVVLVGEPTCVGYNDTRHDSVGAAITKAKQIRIDKREGDPIFANMPIMVVGEDMELNVDETSDIDLVHFILSNS